MFRSQNAKLRLGTPDDLPRLATIELDADRLFLPGRLPDDDTTYPVESFHRSIVDDLLFVAEAGDQVIGFAVSEVVNEHLHLFNLAVHRDFGRRGVGRNLLEKVLETARRRRLHGVTLTTFEDVEWNAPFYKRMGFTILNSQERNPMLDRVLAAEAALGMVSRVAMRHSFSDPQDDPS